MLHSFCKVLNRILSFPRLKNHLILLPFYISCVFTFLLIIVFDLDAPLNAKIDVGLVVSMIALPWLVYFLLVRSLLRNDKLKYPKENQQALEKRDYYRFTLILTLYFLTTSALFIWARGYFSEALK